SLWRAPDAPTCSLTAGPRRANVEVRRAESALEKRNRLFSVEEHDLRRTNMLKRVAKLVSMAAILAVGGLTAQNGSAAEPQKTLAQKVVEEIKAVHTEI